MRIHLRIFGIVWGALLVCAASASVTSSESGSPTTVAYWRFDNARSGDAAGGSNLVLDSSGHHLNGIAFFGPRYTSDVPIATIPGTGNRDSLSMEFNGRNQRIFVPDSPLFELTHGVTLEAFVKVRSAADNERQIVFRGDDRLGYDPYLLSENGASFNFSICNELGQRADVRAPIPALNRWFHVAGTFDAKTGMMRLYVDGQDVAHGTTLVRPFAHLDPRLKPGVGMGNTQSDNYKEYFDGLIDEVRISNASLSPEQLLFTKPETGN